MPISDYKPQIASIEFPGGSFEVRGISLDDMAAVIDVHSTAVDLIREKMLQHQIVSPDQITPELAADVVVSVIRECPSLAAQVISLAADEREAYGIVMKMPITLQMQALRAIGELTFRDLATAKKFVADVRSLIGAILPSPSQITSAN